MANAPRVFISYSHDSPSHKQWIAELATNLRHNGVDAILDQWDVSLGDDITLFMEEGLSSSDRVLVVCTDEYVRKANAGEGGVGYERMIVTAELVKNLGTNKFIPVVRQASGDEKVPRFLGARLYVDFSDDSQFDKQFESLLLEIHKIAATKKPPLGKNPFAVLPSGKDAPNIPPLDTLPQNFSGIENPSEVYNIALELARRGDLLTWRHLVKRVRASAYAGLSEWRTKYDASLPKDWGGMFNAADEAVNYFASLFVVALVGIESGREEFKDQKSLLDDLLNIANWNYSGTTILAEIPSTLVYVYQALHGAMSVSTGQIDLALNFADTKVKGKYEQDYKSLWKRHDLIGWPESIGGDCTKAWTYLANATQRWKWLSDIFGDETEYRLALSAYYMALNIHELAESIVAGSGKAIEEGASFHLEVPLCFASEKNDLNERALSLLLRNPKQIEYLWTKFGVSRADMKTVWPHWVRICSTWIQGVYRNLMGIVPHAKLFDALE